MSAVTEAQGTAGLIFLAGTLEALRVVATDSNARGEMERLNTTDLQPRAAAHDIDGNVFIIPQTSEQALGGSTGDSYGVSACADERVRR